MKTIIQGRAISKGVAQGEALVGKDSLSFLGGIDPRTGIVIEKGNALEGKCVAGKVLVFPRGKGSTVGSYVIYQLAKNKVAPAAMINAESEIIVAVGAIISGIPMVDRLEKNGIESIKDGTKIMVDGNKGTAEIL